MTRTEASWCLLSTFPIAPPDLRSLARLRSRREARADVLRSVNHDPTARPCRMRTVDGARRIEALVGKSSNGNENRDRGQVLCQLRRRFRPTRRQFYTGLDGPPRRRSRTRPRPDGGAAPTAPAPPPAPALCPRLRAGAGARADPDRG